MSEKQQNCGELYEESIKQLSKDLRGNDYVSGTAQFTDMTNATYFYKLYGNKVKYCKPWKKFLVYNGKKWEADEYGYAQSMIDTMTREMYKGARDIHDVRLRMDFEAHLKKSEALRRRDACLASYARFDHARITIDDMDRNPFLLNCENGTMDLETGTFRQHDYKDNITKCSKFIYDKDAQCPTWKTFLLQVLDNDTELIRFVQKIMGYSLCADATEQVMFILWGGGANGKSTFLNVIADLLDDYATTSRPETFTKRNTESMGNDIARLRGSRLVTTAEFEQGKSFNESLVKQVTGNDELTARFLYGEYFSFLPTFKIFMATNHKPIIKGNDYGIWRRIRLIPFTVTIPDHLRDRDLTEKLKAENSGILNWLLEGFKMWKSDGLKSPKTVQKATQNYQDEMDVVGNFICDCLQIDTGGKLRITNKELYDLFQKWASERGEKVYSQRYLSLRLQEKGFVKSASNSERYWKGLASK